MALYLWNNDILNGVEDRTDTLEYLYPYRFLIINNI
jgi:hypothetical protein